MIAAPVPAANSELNPRLMRRWICTADMAFKGCFTKPAAAVCMSSGSCDAGQHCSVEDGVCNSSGMLAVCSGTCVN